MLKYFCTKKMKKVTITPERDRQDGSEGKSNGQESLTTWLQFLYATVRRPNSKCCPLTCPHASTHVRIAHAPKTPCRPANTPCSCNHFSPSQALKTHLLRAPEDKPKWYHYRKLGFCISNGGKEKKDLYRNSMDMTGSLGLLVPPLLFFWW